MSNATQATQMAKDDPDLWAAVQRARKLLHRRAVVAAAASVVPIPGLDWAVDAALLSRLVPQINAEFGLSAEQLDLLDPKKREQVQKAVGLVGSVLIGKLVTREVLMRVVVDHADRKALELFAREIAPAGTSWSPTRIPTG